MRKTGRGSCSRGILCALRTAFQIRSQFAKQRRKCTRKTCKAQPGPDYTEDRKGALAADGRWASEELGLPIPDDRARLDNRLGGADSDQDYYSRGNRNRRRRVHRDAQRTMVGIAVQSMDMRHLDHGHHRQQSQTQQSGCPESAWLPAASAANIRLQSCEQKHLQLQGYIGLDAAGMARVPLSVGFFVHIGDQPAALGGSSGPVNG